MLHFIMAMDREYACSRLQDAINAFAVAGTVVSYKQYGSGHINDTFMLTTSENGHEHYYTLQRMNHEVFTRPMDVLENISGVTRHLARKIAEQGGDPTRETLTLVELKSGGVCFKDSIGCYWRMYNYIADASCFDLVEDPSQMYQSGITFGQFQSLLADYPAHTLHETILDFHNEEKRLNDFRKAVSEDVCGRAASVQKEIDFVLSYDADTKVCNELLAQKALPLRVTHNDTKLSNILIDDKTGKGLCVLDLDTVMPGLSMNDFGDAIRFGACTSYEDEPNLSKVWLDLDLFDVFTKGFMESCGKALTPLEIKMLPFGAKMMTFECGMRALMDYIQGDIYYHQRREGQNLDRARTQLKLLADMEAKWDDMEAIIKRYQ